MSKDENSIPKKKLKKWQIAALVLIVLSIIGQFTGGGNSSEDKASETPIVTNTPEPTVDIYIQSACRKFREFTEVAGKGILTIAEMRAKFKDTYEAAQFSDIPIIADAATRTLAALTAQDAEALAPATKDFSGACIAAGQ